jgi:hypothetical protein
VRVRDRKYIYDRVVLEPPPPHATHVVGPCWRWTGCMYRGYGKTRDAGRHAFAHRIAFRVFVGDIPPGMVVMHECDNGACCSPRHLRLGTIQQNNEDKLMKGRQVFGEGNKGGGNKLDAARAAELKASAARGDETVSAIARRFGVSRKMVRLVRSGEKWTHV